MDYGFELVIVANWNYVVNERFENVCALDFNEKIYLMVRIEVGILIGIRIIRRFWHQYMRIVIMKISLSVIIIFSLRVQRNL